MRMTPEQLRAMTALYARRPASRRRRDLIVEEATRTGGLTLQFWRLFRGHYWNEPEDLSLEECARRLSKPVSELVRVADATITAIRPLWMASPEFKEWIKGHSA